MKKTFIFEDQNFVLFEQYQWVWLEDKKTKIKNHLVNLNIGQKKEGFFNKKTKKFIDETIITGKIDNLEIHDGLRYLKRRTDSEEMQRAYIDYCAKRKQEIEDNWAFVQVFKTLQDKEF